MLQNLFGGKFLDDIDPEQLTDKQKQALKQLFDTDPCGFYNLWRNPDAARRRFEGDDFQPTTEAFPLPAKERPIAEKLQQIDDFCINLNIELNRTDDYNYHPENDFVPEDNPLSGKWQAIMMVIKGEPLAIHHFDGSARHYKATDPVLAASGVEIVEITITAPSVSIDLDAYKVSDDVLDEVLPGHINPYAMKVVRDPDAVRIYLQYDNIYE